MKKELPFIVSARTAKLIGKENFANANGAIIELVKNSYDADAKDSIIIFGRGNLYIIDNGFGMDEENIIENWMKIGTDNKMTNYQTGSKRIKSGAKGIGRFALDRLCSISEMYTTSKESNKSTYWKVDWKNFETSDSISNVMAELDSLDDFDIKRFLIKEFESDKGIIEKISKIGFEHGTILKLTNLNDEWNEKNISILFSNLEILTPPFNNNSFSIFLFDSEIVEIFGMVSTANYDDYDYKIHANYLGNENHEIELVITRDELDIDLLEKEYSDIFDMEQMKKDFFNLKTIKEKTFKTKISVLDFKGFNHVDKSILSKVGGFEFDFYFIKNRASDNKDETDTSIYPYNHTNYATRTAWMNKFGGVRIFRDNFRVRPYGENGDDWLQLGERQGQSPQGAGQRLGAYRIRPNQISGIINISRVYNKYFEDKSGREGIQENEVFELFRNIILGMIGIFEKDRNIIMNSLYKLADNRNENQRKKREADDAARKIEEKKESEQNNNQHSSDENVGGTSIVTPEELALVEGKRVLEIEIEKKDTEIMMLRNLASIGLIVSSFSHELKNIRNSLIPRSEALLKSMKKHISEDSLKSVDKYDNPYYLLDLISQDDLRVKHWLDYSLSSLKRDRRERKNVNFLEYFGDFNDLWEKALEQKQISLSLNIREDEKYILKCFTIDLDSIFNNLLSNSVNSLKYRTKGHDKKIAISVEKSDSFICITFEDNGLGLSDDFKNNPYEIFEAFSTSKVDSYGNKIGTGLGMYIVASVIKEYTDSSITIVEYIDKFSLSIKFKLF